MQLWELVFHHPEAEEFGHELFELGVQALEVREPDEIRVYAEGSAESIAELVQQAAHLGFRLTGKEVVERRDWTALCHELCVPVQIGGILVRPVLEKSGFVPRSADELLIVPGLGFGTGHHATTRSMLELIQDPEAREASPRSVLDLGTGSGILAIAASLLYGSRVAAIDLDLHALQNARDNVELNGAGDRVRLMAGELQGISGHFDLVFANIYTEILIQLHDQLLQRLVPGGLLLLSGVREEQREELAAAFDTAPLTLVRERAADGWIARTYRFAGGT